MNSPRFDSPVLLGCEGIIVYADEGQRAAINRSNMCLRRVFCGLRAFAYLQSHTREARWIKVPICECPTVNSVSLREGLSSELSFSLRLFAYLVFFRPADYITQPVASHFWPPSSRPNRLLGHNMRASWTCAPWQIGHFFCFLFNEWLNHKFVLETDCFQVIENRKTKKLFNVSK